MSEALHILTFCVSVWFLLMFTESQAHRKGLPWWWGGWESACQCRGKVKVEVKVTQSACLFVTPWTIELWNSPGQNTGVGSLSLLQGIFETQESNPGLPHCRRILYQLSHKGSPRCRGHEFSPCLGRFHMPWIN